MQLAWETLSRIGVVTATIFVLLAGIAIAYGLERLRLYRENAGNTLAGVLLGLWCLVLPLITLLGPKVAPDLQRQVNWVPFFIASSNNLQWEQGTVRQLELVGNVLLFVPCGVLLGYLCRGRSWWLLGIPLAVSGIIEAVQYIGRTARVADINDVLLNVAGAAVGYSIWALSSSVLSRIQTTRDGRSPEQVEREASPDTTPGLHGSK